MRAADVIAAVAAAHGLESEDLSGRSVAPAVVQARGRAVLLARELAGASWGRLGQLLDRDPTTALHAARRVRESAMDWSKVANFLVSNGLPLLGGVVGGPAGAAVGRLVAGAVGVSADDPGAVLAAVEADPQALVRLREVEAQNRQELTRLHLAAETQRIEAVNATMRVEAASDRWWVSGWRPFWGFVSAIAWGLFVVAIGWRIAAHGDVAQLTGQVAQIPEAVWYVPLVILGVASWHRGVEKRVRAGEPPAPGVIGRVLGAVGNRG